MEKERLEKVISMSYKVVDKMTGMSLEKGDIVKNPNGDLVVISEIADTDSGYRIYHLDLFEDDIEHFDISDNEYLEVLALD